MVAMRAGSHIRQRRIVNYRRDRFADKITYGPVGLPSGNWYELTDPDPPARPFDFFGEWKKARTWDYKFLFGDPE